MTIKQSGGHAYFDLSKNKSINIKIDKIELRDGFYRSACQYYSAVKILFPKIELMNVTMSNAAFSCELFLKAILYGFDINFGKTHQLEKLFALLPERAKDYIKQNIAIENKEIEFLQCLNEQSKAFEMFRYSCEVKCIAFKIDFLPALADILKFVYESLINESKNIM